MNRRKFLGSIFQSSEGVSHSAASRGSTTGVDPYNGPWTKKQVAHLLRRTMFGAAYQDINYFLGKTLPQAVDELLTPGQPPAPPLNYYGQDSGAALGQTWVNASFDVSSNVNRALSLLAWCTRNMAKQARSIEEKMVLFWLNHFGTNIQVYVDARFGYKHVATIRQHCLGNFKDMVKAITLDPAMLRFLNGDRNTKNRPDENYARELFELFTIGKDGGQKYEESDVIEAARVLTGYRILSNSVTYTFDSSKHDTGNKQFSALFNYRTIAGKSGSAGQQELDELLDMIFQVNDTALFICRKLYRYFVYYEIDAQVEANVIVPMANVFRTSGYDIKAPLRLLFNSEHFFDDYNLGAVIKQPMDLLIGSLRETNAIMPSGSDFQAEYSIWQQFGLYGGTALQQLVLAPPTVAGWQPFHQEPNYHQLWISTVTLPLRNQFTDLLVYAGLNVGNSQLAVDTARWLEQYPNPDNVDKVIDEVIEHLLTHPLSSNHKILIRAAMLGGQSNPNVWTQLWNDYKNNPNNPNKKKAVTDRLKSVLKYITSLDEYQLS
ncbi:MAG: DUF1800 domain-containing protein [Chitinophagales bacterium]|nr:DUF1800 domain-containing protein [Chitinophagales bacterium]MDW8274118.1 DUF1800 domain-containing protein [Chitinophagales bacterium]